MSDKELIARLRKADEYEPLGHDGWEAAARIEALTAERDALKAAQIDAIRAALEAAASCVSQNSLQWRFSCPWLGKDFAKEIRAIDPAAIATTLTPTPVDVSQTPDPVNNDQRVKTLVEKVRDWEARIEDCEWSANSSLTEDIRAEMSAALRALEGEP